MTFCGSNGWVCWMPAACAWLVLAAALLALLIDHLWGEPPVRWHPVVWMGHALGWAGARVAPLAQAGALPAGEGGQGGRAGLVAAGSNRSDSMVFWLGALYWIALAALVLIVAWAVQTVLLAGVGWLVARGGSVWWVLAAVGLGLCLKPLLAWRMLRTEVLAVEAALGQSLAAGRERLGWLVSRDVTQLTEAQVRESAIESLAENLSDSVVAPLFWFVLAGLPGAALYRFANTADAMWGYRTVRGGRQWEWAGKWAARADDVLNWLPARLTGGVLALWAGWRVLRALPAQAGLTPSPNSGWPMAAMALALGIRLGKPGVYVLNAAGRQPVAADVQQAVKWCKKVLLILLSIALTAMIFTIISW